MKLLRTKYVTAKTKQLAEKIISEKGTYRPPEQLTVDLNYQRRKEKEAMAEERERLVKRVSYDMPKAAKERVEAIVFKTL